MTRRTSIEAYHRAKAEGLIGRRQFQIYEIVYDNGPMTANQAYNLLAQKMGATFRFDSNTRARFTELRDMGWFKECGTVIDPITKMSVILWDISNEVPNGKPLVNKQKKSVIEIHNLVTHLLTEVNLLKQEIQIMKTKGQADLF